MAFWPHPHTHPIVTTWMVSRSIQPQSCKSPIFSLKYWGSAILFQTSACSNIGSRGLNRRCQQIGTFIRSPNVTIHDLLLSFYHLMLTILSDAVSGTRLVFLLSFSKEVWLLISTEKGLKFPFLTTLSISCLNFSTNLINFKLKPAQILRKISERKSSKI